MQTIDTLNKKKYSNQKTECANKSPPEWIIQTQTGSENSLQHHDNIYNDEVDYQPNRISLSDQLIKVRQEKNRKYLKFRETLGKEEVKEETEKNGLNPPGTCLILGDSIINNIVEKNLSKKRFVK